MFFFLSLNNILAILDKTPHASYLVILFQHASYSVIQDKTVFNVPRGNRSTCL